VAPFRLSSSREHLERWIREAANSVPPGSLVLDAGAGQSPYAKWFSAHRYESADFAQVAKDYSRELTYVCDLASLPVEDERFDLIVMTQVLEHLPEPGRVLGEMRRILKPGAVIWFSTPLFYEEHEKPYDYFRYTQFGLRHLCQQAGLEVASIDWLEGYFGTLAYQLRMVGSDLPVDASIYGGGAKGFAVAIAARCGRRGARWLGGQFDRFDSKVKVTTAGMPKNYAVTARRTVEPLVGASSPT
jgi:SAM-dependent methyltransferase